MLQEITIQPAKIDEKPIIGQMLELYLYDFSEFSGQELDEQGRYGYAYLDYYWTETGRYPFLARVNSHLAGFSLVREVFEDGVSIYTVAEFFILRKYRSHNYGRKMAYDIFNRFKGKWCVETFANNEPAKVFWRKVISDYTDGHFAEQTTVFKDDGIERIIWSFERS